MQKFISILILVFSFLLLLVLIISVLIITNTEPSWLAIPESRISLASSIPISFGVLIAILTFVNERRRQEQESARNRAKFYLELAEKGFEEVYKLLQDQNNNRMTWLRAARVLLKTQELKTQINSEEYRRAFLQVEERVRNELYRVLTIEGEHAERNSLPPQFYYGIEDWAEPITLNDAAIQSSTKIISHSINIDSVIPETPYKQLAVPSIIAIYNFLKYPKDYEEPLINVKEWEEDWTRVTGIDQGAIKYIKHNKEYYVSDGKAFKRNKEQE